jgi:sporulation protein YlmC with PRC-barrel domain
VIGDVQERLDIAYRVLDIQLVDVDGRRCGRVDDIELRGAVGEPLHVEALLTGRGVYPSRLPARLRRIGRRVFGAPVLGRTVHRVPWTAVEDVRASVMLREPASELDLAHGDLMLGALFSHRAAKP